MLRTFLRCATALIAVASAAHVLAAPVTFDEAVRLAEQRSRQLPAQEAAARSAREMAVAAGQRPDPVLKAGVDNLPVTGADRWSLTNDFMTMRTIGVMQEWTRSGKLEARASKFQREAEMAEARKALALANLRRDTAVAWLDRHYQQQARAVLMRERDEAALQVQGAEAAYRGGRGAQVDVLGARAAAAQIDDRIAATDRDLLTASTMLTRWTGAPANEVAGSPPDIADVPLHEHELEGALADHPDVALLLKQEAVAQADAEAARLNREPDVSVEITYAQRGPAYSNMVSFNVTLPLPWDRKDRQDRELAAKLATVEQLREQREEELRMHVAETRTMLQQWRSGLARLQRYDAELLPLSSDRTRAALAAYRGGSGALAAVLDARRAEVEVRLDRLRLEMETARWWAQLRYVAPSGRTATETKP